MSYKRASALATIDVSLITLDTEETTSRQYALDTASKVSIESQLETKDAIKLIIKGALKAQKGKEVTLTGTQITLTDNVFTPELVQILQGGTLKYWQDSSHTTEGTTDAGYGVSSYTPPVAGVRETSVFFTLKAYSAIYNAAAQITGYECIEYPHCYGDPIALTSEDDVFRVPEYTINSSPDVGEPPYKITYVSELPTIS